MAKETSRLYHEQALTVLEAAAQEGALPEAHKASLAELAGQGIRTDVNETLAASSGASVAKTPAIIIAQPREVRELVKSLRLEEGYAEALETQKFFELLRLGEQAPDFSQVLKTFTPEMLAQAKSFSQPSLVLNTKGQSLLQLVSAINDHKTVFGQNNGVLEVGSYAPFDYVEKPRERWSAYIVDGLGEMDLIQEFDNVDHKLGGRHRSFNDYLKTKGLLGMEHFTYTHLMMQRLRNGKPIDQRTKTLLNVKPEYDLNITHREVAEGGWNSYNLAFSMYFSFEGMPDCPLRERLDFVRFRRMVGGDVPNA